MLSALHTVRMSPGLLSGLRSPLLAAPPPAAAAKSQLLRGAACCGPALLLPVGGSSRLGRASIALPEPSSPAAASVGRGGARSSPGNAKGSAGVLGGKGSPAAGAAGVAWGSPGESGKRRMADAVQREAVRSVAQLVSALIHERQL